MRFWRQTITNLQSESNQQILRRCRYGVIEVADGALAAIHIRQWPKIVSLPEVWWLGGQFHHRMGGDRCWLYYNQPRRCSNFLILKYVVSSSQCAFGTFRRAVLALDHVAKIKQVDALLCEASNPRISARLLVRWGWERHVLTSPRRHYIKRFYGRYPELPPLESLPLTTSQNCEDKQDAQETFNLAN